MSCTVRWRISHTNYLKDGSGEVLRQTASLLLEVKAVSVGALTGITRVLTWNLSSSHHSNWEGQSASEAHTLKPGESLNLAEDGHSIILTPCFHEHAPNMGALASFKRACLFTLWASPSPALLSVRVGTSD